MIGVCNGLRAFNLMATRARILISVVYGKHVLMLIHVVAAVKQGKACLGEQFRGSLVL